MGPVPHGKGEASGETRKGGSGSIFEGRAPDDVFALVKGTGLGTPGVIRDATQGMTTNAAAVRHLGRAQQDDCIPLELMQRA